MQIPRGVIMKLTNIYGRTLILISLLILSSLLEAKKPYIKVEGSQHLGQLLRAVLQEHTLDNGKLDTKIQTISKLLSAAQGKKLSSNEENVVKPIQAYIVFLKDIITWERQGRFPSSKGGIIKQKHLESIMKACDNNNITFIRK
jgi:hypothetical protein